MEPPQDHTRQPGQPYPGYGDQFGTHPSAQPGAHGYPTHPGTHPGAPGHPAYPDGMVQAPRRRAVWKVILGVLLTLVGLVLSLATLGTLSTQLGHALQQDEGYMIGTLIGFGVMALLSLALLVGGILLIVQPGRHRVRPPR